MHAGFARSTRAAGGAGHAHFQLLPGPDTDLGEAERARHIDAVRRMARALYAD